MPNTLGQILGGTRFTDGTGKFAAGNSGVSEAYATILNVASGAGFLTGISFIALVTSNADPTCKITIDGTLQMNGEVVARGNTGGLNGYGLGCIHRFNSSLKVEVACPDTNPVRCAVAYTLE